MLKNILIGCVGTIVAACAGSSDAPTGSAASQAALAPNHYVVFFAPKASRLDAEGQAVVHEAVAAIEQRRPSKIEIVVPTAVPAGPDVVEARYATIQNIISASGMDADMYSRVALASGGINLPGADDRAEIRLIP